MLFIRIIILVKFWQISTNSKRNTAFSTQVQAQTKADCVRNLGSFEKAWTQISKENLRHFKDSRYPEASTQEEKQDMADYSGLIPFKHNIYLILLHLQHIPQATFYWVS